MQGVDAKVADIALGATTASLPWWALQSQAWLIYIGAVAGAILAIGRLIHWGVQVWRSRGVQP